MGYTFKDVPRHVRDYHPYISATQDTRFRGYSYTQKYSKSNIGTNESGTNPNIDDLGRFWNPRIRLVGGRHA